MKGRPPPRRRALAAAAALALALAAGLGDAPPASAAPGADAGAPPAAAKGGDATTGGAAELLKKGEAQFDDQRYEDAIQTLSAALMRPDSSASEKVAVYRLLALSYITLGKLQEAESAVRGLLVLDPAYDLSPSESPRFRDFFAKVRERWEGEGRPGLEKPDAAPKPVLLRHEPLGEQKAGEALEIRVRLTDPGARVRTVDLKVKAGRGGDGEPADAVRTRPMALAAGTARATIPGTLVKGPFVEYWVEARDEDGELVATRGDADAPLRAPVADGGGTKWLLPVLLGTGVVGGTFAVLALAGVFSGGSSSPPPGPGPAGRSVVTVTVGP